jgi:N-acetylornithine carbamoyltransferase
MRHWISMLDWKPAEMASLVAEARQLKAGDRTEAVSVLDSKTLVMVFFNSSLRTRTSFEAGMLRYGGHAITLNVGKDTWKLEHRDGVVMDGEYAEHFREAVPVLGRYGELLAVRSFAEMKDPAEDAKDLVLKAFGEFSSVPVLNMESAAEHPCQGLADWMTMDEKLGGTKGKRCVVTWAPHIKPLPMAVPQSAVLSAAAAGMDVTIAHPPGYELNAGIMDRASSWCAAAGSKLTVTDQQVDACREADAVYVKSWGSAEMYGDAAAQKASFKEHSDWTVTASHLGAESILMHCLPVRRNVVISDDALDDPRSAVIDEAENRMWAQVAVMSDLLNHGK